MASLISAGTATNTAVSITGDTTGALAFATNNGTTAVTIDTSQNVGVGVTANTTNIGGTYSLLSVGKTSGSGIFMGQSDITASGSTVAQFLGKTTGASGYQLVGGMLVATDGTSTTDAVGRLLFYTASGGSVTERVRIDSSGNMGIGTTSPAARLHVSQALNADTEVRIQNTQSGGYATALRLLANGTTGTSYNYIESYDATNSVNHWAIGGRGVSQTLCFTTGGAERMRITPSGGVGIGQSPTAYAQFQVLFDATNSNNNYLGIGVSPAANTSGAVYVRFYNATGNGCGDISRNGTSNAVIYGTSSDYRLKENIAPMTGALTKVSLLKPVTFTWKDSEEQAEGFIAHELQEIIPTAVAGQKDAVDENGNPKYQNMDASYIVATLTAAIQELKAIVDAQAVEIAALKAKVGS
jgi:hypothetical protein